MRGWKKKMVLKQAEKCFDLCFHAMYDSFMLISSDGSDLYPCDQYALFLFTKRD